MRSVRRRDTAPELALRRELHRLGFRYRVDVPPLASLRRRADVVFTRAKVAVFVDGCFWHGCSEHRPYPRANRDYWKAKIERNRTRDAETDAILEAHSWTIIRIWEHDDPVDAAREVAATVRANQRSRRSQAV